MVRRARKDDPGAAPASRVKPENGSRKKSPSHRQIEHLFHELEKLMATDKDLQAQVDELKANVAALQAVPQPVQLISQAQLDSDVADVTAANAALKALVPPAV